MSGGRYADLLFTVTARNNATILGEFGEMSRLFVLGRFELRASDEGNRPGAALATQPKRLALATYLALATPRGYQRRDALVALFWPEATQDEARNALRQALHHLRQQLGDAAIATRSDDQVALVDGHFWCDAVELERAIEAGDDALAVQLYEGPFLEAVFVRGVASEFEEWVDRTRTRLRTAAAAAAQRLADKHASSEMTDEAIAATRRRCDIEPDNEAAFRALFTLLDDHGRRADAINESVRFRQQLKQRYEVDPAPETEALIESIRSGARIPAIRSAPPPPPPPPSTAAAADRVEPPFSRASRPKWRRWAALGAGLSVLAALAFYAAQQRGNSGGENVAPLRRIFVTDFTDVTPSTSLGPLVASAVRIDLAQSPRLRVLTTSQVRAAMRLMNEPVEVAIDDSLARLIAIREGVTGFVTGDVQGIGSTFVLSARLVAAPTGDQLAAAREVARDSADIMPAIERLSRSLRHRIGENVSQVAEALPLTRVTTSSLTALEKYTEGLRLIDVGERAQGVALLEQSVAIDSGFATAYRMLGSTYSVLGEPARAAAALGKAFANSNRLTFKERYLVRGSYYRNVTQEYDRAIDAYRSLLALYPDDIAGLNNLALTFTSVGNHAAAESLFLRVIAADSTQINARLVVAEGRAAQGRFAEARAMLDETRQRFPEHPVVGLTSIYIAAAESDWPRAEEFARRRLASVTASVQRIDALQTLGQIELLRGKVAAAREHLEQSMRLAQVESSPRKYLWSAVVLGWLDLRYRNRPADARRRLERALAVYPLSKVAIDDVPVTQLAGLYAALGMDAQLRAFRSIDVERIGGSQLAGIRLTAAGNFREAAQAFREASPPSAECPICVLPDLAAAEEQAGNIDSAIAAADRYVRTPFIHRFESDAAHLSTTLLRLGRLYETTNQPTKAIDAYERLLTTWRSADAELAPQISALRTQIDDLKTR